MRFYKCLGKQDHSIGNYIIRPVREDDKTQIMLWRNAQMDVLRQNRILTEADQEKYFNTTISSLFDNEFPEQLLFSFLQDDLLIGYGGLVHINWQDKRGEVSFLLDNERSSDNDLYEKDFTCFLTLMKQVAFDHLGFNRIYTETFDIRPFHISVLEKNQFLLEGRMKQHVFIKNNYYDSLIHGFIKEYYYVQE